MSNTVKWLLVVLGLALPVAVIVGESYFRRPAAVKPVSTPDDAIFFAKEVMLKIVTQPDKTTFPEDHGFQVEHVEENRWRVSASALTYNQSGAPVAIPFTVVIERQGSRWVLIDREMRPNNLTKHIQKNSWTNHLQDQKGK